MASAHRRLDLCVARTEAAAVRVQLTRADSTARDKLASQGTSAAAA